jgi:hypothetical protein
MSLIPEAGGTTPDTAGKSAPAVTPAAGEGAPAGGTTPPVVTPSGDWYYDHNIKGDGTPPDWFKGDKYKTVTDQAKAYSEVEKKLGAFKGAPEKYDLAIAEHPDLKFSEEDPLLKDFLDSAKKNGVSQEYVTELLGVYAQALTYGKPDSDAEMKKIGVNAEQDLQILSQWAGNVLSAEEFGVFKGMVTTADAFKVFDKLRNAGVAPEVTDNTRHTPHESKDQILAMVNDPRYDTDEAFRADVRGRLSRAMAREGAKK